MSQLADTFAQCRAQNRAALIAYLPSGFPTTQDCPELLCAMVEAGVDIVEIGLPYSDPLMDGPTIQAAVDVALAGGSTVSRVFDTVAEVARAGAPTLVMSYWNPIERLGVDRFAQRLADVGGAGVITADLTPEEAGPWIRATDEAGVDRVFLVAPSSTQARLVKVAQVSSGFVYAASTMGVTGARGAVGAGARTLVERTRAATNRPICVGLGVSTGVQAAEVAKYADGVIVGSAFVSLIADAGSMHDARRNVANLARDLAQGVRAR